MYLGHVSWRHRPRNVVGKSWCCDVRIVEMFLYHRGMIFSESKSFRSNWVIGSFQGIPRGARLQGFAACI